MNNSEGLKPFQQSLAGLPQWVSERILQQINQLTRYEPVIGIMGKSGAGKSSLCNALFASEVSPVSDVAACTREPLRFRLQVGDRYITRRGRKWHARYRVCCAVPRTASSPRPGTVAD